MSTYLSLNRKIHQTDALVLTVQNRGFRYGDALFETVKCVNGVPLFLNAHLQRLYSGMKTLGFNWNDQLLKTVVNDEAIRLLSRNRFTEGARLRITVFREGGGLYTPETNDVSVLLETYPDENGFQLNANGLSLGVFEEFQKPIHPFSELKSANALLFVRAGISKLNQGVDDVIILNSKGLICETISSNIFLVIHNRLVTPPLSEGCLPGVMRQNVLAIAQDIGMEILETPVGINALDQAEEVFLSNAIKGVQWVKGFKQKRYFHKISETMISELNKAVSTK